MNGFSKIIERIERIDVISGVEFDIDTKGLNCVLKPMDADIWVCVRPGSAPNERFMVKAGENLEFCGKIYFYASTSGYVSYYMYKTL